MFMIHYILDKVFKDREKILISYAIFQELFLFVRKNIVKVILLQKPFKIDIKLKKCIGVVPCQFDHSWRKADKAYP